VENQIRQGEIYFVYLDPVFGRELGGYKCRPVVVASINDIHQHTRLVTVVPGTTTESSHPNVVRVQGDGGNGLKETTFFQCHQVRGIDQGRMTSRYIGRMSRADFQRVQDGLRIVFGLLPD
jgi:mRNA-degrading endonuclease toxin of MazEF toxin-antitoxin module